MAHRRVLRLTLGAAFLCSAQLPVAIVSSSEPFRLRGITVPVGVPTWPVFAGDTISTPNSAATLRIPDGSRLTLGASSQVTLVADGPSLSARLERGSVSYTIPAGAQMQLLGQGGQVLARAGSSGITGAPPSSASRSASAAPVSEAFIPSTKLPSIGNWRRQR